MIVERPNNTRTLLILCALTLLCLFSVGGVLAADEFAIPWWTVDSGGVQSVGGSFVITGTLGQPDAGISAAGSYTLVGSFWGAFWKA